MILDELKVPIVLAPMAGGPSTPDLAAAVSTAGGLGFLASGYLEAEALRGDIEATRALADPPFGVNVFTPGQDPADPALYEPYVERLAAWANERGAELGAARFDDDDFARKIDLLADDPVAVVSFTFGCPSREVIERLQAAGSEVWVTVTNPAEAAAAASAGADALVVQGLEAGGHRGTFVDSEDAADYSLLALLQIVGSGHDLPLVGTGAIASGGAVAAALAAGAAAVQVGSAFMLCPEAGTSAAQRAALRSDTETALTRAFTGRLARGIRNDFMAAHGPGAPIAYPEIHHVTAPLRKAARERGDDTVINLWAGQAHRLAREAPAADVVRELVDAARSAAAASCARLAAGDPRVSA